MSNTLSNNKSSETNEKNEHKRDSDIFYNNGLSRVAVCKSEITYINSKGKLTYFGHEIEELVNKHSYFEVFYLLVNKRFPSEYELKQFGKNIENFSEDDPKIINFINNFAKGTDPMSILSALMNYLEVYYLTNNKNNKSKINTSEFIWAKALKTILYLHNLENNKFDYFVNKKIMEKMFILHADLAVNCSTFSLRTALSAGSSLFSSIAAAINTLSGPKHGSANLFVLNQLLQIQKENIQIDKFIENSLKNKKSIWGFGHRVFKVIDPRSSIIKKIAKSLINNNNKELFNVYDELENKVLKHEYFIEKKLFTNVDYWTSFVYYSLGISKKFMPSMFALARIPGWIAHYYEALNDTETKIVHPQQIYIGK